MHWARDAAEARAVVLGSAGAPGARSVTKSKSMVTEEIGLNEFLEANGIAPVETDLGEYILQISGQPPSHIVGPAVHMTKDEISDLFAEHHGRPRGRGAGGAGRRGAPRSCASATSRPTSASPAPIS